MRKLIVRALPLLFAAQVMAATAPREVLPLGDIEGRIEILESFIHGQNAEAGKEIIKFSADRSRLVIAPGYKVNFLGDAIDHGKNSMEILDIFNATLEAQPEQFDVIKGNRDGNKVRLNRELTPEALATVPEGLEAWMQKKGIDFTDANKTNREIRTKFIFEATMGMPTGFENRRAELATYGKKANATDAEVVDSFLADYREGGRGWKYLMKSKAIIAEMSGLYVHAAIIDSNVEVLEKNAHLGPEKAVAAVNEAHLDMVRRALDLSIPNGHLELVAEVTKAAGSTVPTNPKSFTYSNYEYAKDGGALTLENTSRVRKLLAGWKMNYVLFGHKPKGEAPVLVTTESGDFRLIGLDTTYKQAIEGKLASPVVRVFEDSGSEIRMVTPMPDGEKIIARHVKGTRTILGQVIEGVQIIGWNTKGEFVGTRMDNFKVSLKSIPSATSERSTKEAGRDGTTNPLERSSNETKAKIAPPEKTGFFRSMIFRARGR